MRRIVIFSTLSMLFVLALIVVGTLGIGVAEVCADPSVRLSRTERWMALIETGGVLALFTGLLAVLAPTVVRSGAARVAAALSRRPLPVLLGVAVAVTSACALTAYLVLDSFANSADEYAFQFQGWTLAAGRLWNEPPALLQAESIIYVWATPDKWVGQYPPGWPAVLAAANLLRFPEPMVNALLIGLCALLIGLILRREDGAVTAVLGAACFALSPFAIFNGASPFAHPLAAVAGLVFVLAAVRWLQEGRATDVAVAGLALGILGVTRYLSAVPLFLPFAVVVLAHWLRRRPLPGRAVTASIILAVTVVPFVVGLLAYHWLLTGDPFKTGYWMTGSYATTMHFDPTTLKYGLLRTFYRFEELARWTSPFLLLAYAMALYWKLRSRTFRFYDAIFPLTVLLLVSYPSLGGVRWGPRYYFDAYPFMILTTAAGFAGLLRASGERMRLLAAAGIATAFVGMLSTYPFFAYHAARVIDDRQDLFRALQAAPLDGNAAVLINEPSGTLCPMAIEDLARNGLKRAGRVRLVRGDLVDAAAVRVAYPDRRLWIYGRQPGAGTTSLHQVP
jgi:hypothetical protein